MVNANAWTARVKLPDKKNGLLFCRMCELPKGIKNPNTNCNYSTPRFDSLRQHLQTHIGHKPYVCGNCDAQLAQRAGLANHIKRHLNYKAYPCPKCPQKCSSQSNLKRHIARRHCNPIIARRVAVEKRFKCQVCDYSCTHMSILAQHNQTHTDEKPFKCENKDCTHSFKRPFSLQRHLLQCAYSRLG